MVVRGDPCTGTSRAAWEAVAELLAEWPLEFPRTAAALAARLEAGIPPGTVLWLWAEPGPACGAGRRRDRAARPGRPTRRGRLPGRRDHLAVAMGCLHRCGRRRARRRRRLAGRADAGPAGRAPLYDPSSIRPDYGGGFLDVPARFTAGELAEAAGSGDPLLAAAAAAAGPDGRLNPVPGRGPRAAAPLRRPGGDPRGRAVLTAAMDASRFGLAGPLLATLLERAAGGYLPGTPSAADRENEAGGKDAPGTGLAWACAAESGGAEGSRRSRPGEVPGDPAGQR